MNERIERFNKLVTDSARLQNGFARVESISRRLELELAALQRDEAEITQKLDEATQHCQDPLPSLMALRDALLQRSTTHENIAANHNEAAALARQSVQTIGNLLRFLNAN